MKDDFKAVLYSAVGVLNREQRAARDSQLLNSENPASDLPAGMSINTVGVTIYTVRTDTLAVGIRPVTHPDEAVSIELERFEMGWPGNDEFGRARDPASAFSEWLSSPDGQAKFGSAGTVQLYAIDLASIPASG